LAGGRSIRLGQDKARAFLSDNLKVIEYVYLSIKPAANSWIVVADKEDKFADLGLETIVDTQLHRGPLGGILRAATEVEDGYFIIISCDRIGLKAAWFDGLKKALKQNPSSKAAAFWGKDFWEPLFGIYHSSLAGEIEKRLDKNQASVWRFLQEIDAVKVEAPLGWERTFSVNHPEDLERARKYILDFEIG